MLAQRMHLILDLFRCRHEWDALFEPPFTAVQLADLQNGRRPLGPPVTWRLLLTGCGI